MPKYTDQIGNSILLSEKPKRIVSLVPSQTELLYSLGLNKEVVGITKFCIHPDSWFHSKTRVGGTKNINFEKIAALNPDLIIANKEENTELEIKELIKRYSVWVSDIKNLPSAYEMIINLGKITEKEEKAVQIANNIQKSFENLSNILRGVKKINTSNPLYQEGQGVYDQKTQFSESPLKNQKSKNVLYLIWNDPYMSINSNTFISDLLELNNWNNVTKSNSSRYPEISIDELKKLNPELIFLSSEPYPFKEKHKIELQKILPMTKIIFVDGELFSWYGSRLLKAPDYFKSLHQIINLR